MTALALACLLVGAAPPVRIELAADGTAFEAIGLDPTALASAGCNGPARFRVTLKADPRAAEPPPLLGEYSRSGNRLRFVPRFPPVPGNAYRATLLTEGGPVVADFAIPALDPAPRTAVVAVYPSADRLPENALRFYVQFTGPMSRKDVYRRVSLARDDGKAVETPFLEIEEQLWSADGTRLTLLCDPGRVKRGLVPREEEGPILEEGRRYTLAVERGWEDADGRPLREAYRKTFSVGPPDDEPLDPQSWSLIAPRPGTDAPLIVRLAKPLDRALLARTIGVTDEAGRIVEGTATVGGGERVVTFAPTRTWAAGRYRLTVDARLEDACGNRVGEPFEVDVFRPVQSKAEGKTASRPFEVRAAGTR